MSILKKLSVILSQYSFVFCNHCKQRGTTPWEVVRCGGCDSVQYCCVQCAERDRTVHGTHCGQIDRLKDRLQEVRTLGYTLPRYREKLALLTSQHDPYRCSYCGRPAAVGCSSRGWDYCAACNTARYCSKQCQVSDWTRKHKAECKDTLTSRHVGRGCTDV